ncbi:MAG: ABC transporter substrate-binding protein [Jiangellales bacterium]
MTVRVSRKVTAVAGLAAFSLVLAACGSDDGDDAAATGDAGGDDASAAASYPIDCAAYEGFGDLSGTSVSTYSSVLGTEAEAYEESFVPFEECTGVDISPEWSSEFEAQIIVRVQGGNAPDLALYPQPGGIQSVQDQTGAVIPVPDEALAVYNENFDPYWAELVTFDGEVLGIPNSSNSKSFVWYSPSAFAEAGYEVPTTWEEMIALSDQIVADNPDGTIKPWCAGIGSGEATGWVVTDWVEDVMLREQGPDYYDQWVTNEAAFNAPESLAVWDKVGSILRNPDYVNGGFGDVQTIASTSFQDGGLPIIDGSCFMHRQASFYAANWPEGTEIGEDADVFAFYFPANEGSEDKPVLVGSEYWTSFDSRPEITAFLAYLASADYANARALAGEGFVNANLNLDLENVSSPISQLAGEQFQDSTAVIRFDGADLMPAEVGSGSFWSEATEWIASNKDTQAVLDAIQATWP